MDQVFVRKATEGFDIMYRSPVKVEVLHIQNDERAEHSKACGLCKPELDHRVKQFREKSKARKSTLDGYVCMYYIPYPQNFN